MRNTKAFKTAVGETLSELAKRGVTLRPGTVEDVVERNITTIAERLGIQVRSAWNYFDAAVMAQGLAEQGWRLEAVADSGSAGAPPMPPPGNPELAVILAGIPDALAETGGDLYSVIVNAVVNAWTAGHIHGEDGCLGCEGARGEAGHDWEARMEAVTRTVPDIGKWFDRTVWTRALNDAGFSVERR